ncbi:hypothetical protein [Pseudotamlana carrageenivorans]|uniref:Uncharacterized protein n=1 Tax=Pseudotamlana carrageenivorans TaxID=2069432 RepID=A0A2I7SKN7_9FLAO|nr:hypothetical protein [Tamlana carrageenivorans]AUS06485.1 hypothetical protein C1A40_13980 [Tamlana carrageenivorans]
MSWELELQRALEKLKKREVFCFVAQVTEVDKTNGVCKVHDGELEFTDVRLSAVIDGKNKKCFVFPKVGSTVLVEPINEDLKQLYVSKYSEVESVSWLIETTQFLMDENGFKIARENENLKQVLNDWQEQFGKLCDEVAKIYVSIGVTPNVIEIMKIKNEVSTSIKQRLNTILKA